jgi:hypothetical protein
MRKLFAAAIIIVLHNTGFTQDRCTAIHEYSTPARAYKNTQIAEAGNAGVAASPVLLQQTGNLTHAALRIVVPVVVHILYRTPQENISDDQVRSQLEALNADFNKENTDFAKVPAVFAARSVATGIRFVLASVDPQGRPTSGIIRKQTSAQLWINDNRIKSTQSGGSDGWDSRGYLNIWVGKLSSSLLGFSSFPGAPAAHDGIVIRYDVFGTRGAVSPPWNKGRTLTHEVGHWLGLKHLWGDTPCGDDGVDDTPRQKTGNRGNPVFPRINTGCDNGTEGDMFMNFMDFSDDASLLMFTKGQSAIMRTQFAAGGVRSGILLSKGAGEPWTIAPENKVSVTGSVSAYPNPARSAITIRFDAPVTGTYVVYDDLGRALLHGAIKGTAVNIDVSSLRTGIHFIRMDDGRVQRFMRE